MRARSAKDKVDTTKRYEDMLNRKDIDAVVIATPDHWHRKITLDALAAGKHVYCEKPMTWRLEEGPEIIAAEKKSGKIVMIGSGTKTSALAQKVKELMALEGDRSGLAHPHDELQKLGRGCVALPNSARRVAGDDRLGPLAGDCAEAPVHAGALFPLALLVGVRLAAWLAICSCTCSRPCMK